MTQEDSVQLFIRSKTVSLNVIAFKYSLCKHDVQCLYTFHLKSTVTTDYEQQQVKKMMDYEDYITLCTLMMIIIAILSSWSSTDFYHVLADCSQQCN